MGIYLYNTLNKKKELFTPIRKGEVHLYTCGPTVYDFSHIGNFRTFIFEDLLKRWLLHIGYKVSHVMNITDGDDKTKGIPNRSNSSIIIKLLFFWFT